VKTAKEQIVVSGYHPSGGRAPFAGPGRPERPDAAS